MDIREHGNMLSRPNQSKELQSCCPMCWEWGGLTVPCMLRMSKWASNLDGKLGTA